MNQGKICVSVCAETAFEAIEQIQQADALADVIEIRFDCLAPTDIAPLTDYLRSFKNQFLITFRPTNQGGKRSFTSAERKEFWELILDRLQGSDSLVDFELDLERPKEFDAERTIASYHDFDGSGETSAQFGAIAQTTAGTIKFAVSVNDAVDAIGVWKLLGSSERKVIPIAMGEAGKWTRILGLAHGSPVTYASLDVSGGTAPGQIPAQVLRDVFRVKDLDQHTDVYGVVAGNTSYSLSPYMQNAAFKKAQMNAVFLPLQVADLDQFILRMVRPETREVELNFRGFSVTNPHKQTIIKHLDQVDETAKEIGAVNTVKIDGESLVGFNTDAPGFIEPLKEMLGDLKGSRAVIAGSGGSARACVYALQQEGVEVTVLVRHPERASAFAEEFGVKVDQLTTDGRQLNTDILVNATPLGTRGDNESEAIASADELRDVKIVYDLVYNPSQTKLLLEAKAAGSKTLGGLDMLVAQGAKQFEIWTGGKAPAHEMRAAVEERLK